MRPPPLRPCGASASCASPFRSSPGKSIKTKKMKKIKLLTPPPPPPEATCFRNIANSLCNTRSNCSRRIPLLFHTSCRSTTSRSFFFFFCSLLVKQKTRTNCRAFPPLSPPLHWQLHIDEPSRRQGAERCECDDLHRQPAEESTRFSPARRCCHTATRSTPMRRLLLAHASCQPAPSGGKKEEDTTKGNSSVVPSPQSDPNSFEGSCSARQIGVSPSRKSEKDEEERHIHEATHLPNKTFLPNSNHVRHANHPFPFPKMRPQDKLGSRNRDRCIQDFFAQNVLGKHATKNTSTPQHNRFIFQCKTH